MKGVDVFSSLLEVAPTPSSDPASKEARALGHKFDALLAEAVDAEGQSSARGKLSQTQGATDSKGALPGIKTTGAPAAAAPPTSRAVQASTSAVGGPADELAQRMLPVDSAPGRAAATPHGKLAESNGGMPTSPREAGADSAALSDPTPLDAEGNKLSKDSRFELPLGSRSIHQSISHGKVKGGGAQAGAKQEDAADARPGAFERELDTAQHAMLSDVGTQRSTPRKLEDAQRAAPVTEVSPHDPAALQAVLERVASVVARIVAPPSTPGEPKQTTRELTEAVQSVRRQPEVAMAAASGPDHEPGARGPNAGWDAAVSDMGAPAMMPPVVDEAGHAKELASTTPEQTSVMLPATSLHGPRTAATPQPTGSPAQQTLSALASASRVAATASAAVEQAMQRARVAASPDASKVQTVQGATAPMSAGPTMAETPRGAPVATTETPRGAPVATSARGAVLAPAAAQTTPPGVAPMASQAGASPASQVSPGQAPSSLGAGVPSATGTIPTGARGPVRAVVSSATTDTARSELAGQTSAAPTLTQGATETTDPKTGTRLETPAATPVVTARPTTAMADPALAANTNATSSLPLPTGTERDAGTASEAKAKRAGDRPTDEPIGRIHGFTRGALAGQAFSAYGGRGHEGAEHESAPRSRRTEERETTAEGVSSTERLAQPDFTAVVQAQQPAPEAPPPAVAPPQANVPVAPPMVEVPDVQFVGRPPDANTENASISIHHPDLGPIQLEVHRDQGRVEVHAVLDTVHAEAVLRANERGIRQGVQQSGMTFSALRVRVRGEESSARPVQTRRRRGNERET